jgi:chaperonin GroES
VVHVSTTERAPANANGLRASNQLPIQLLHDRVLVRVDTPEGERRSSGGIGIPATAQVGRRLVWAEVAAVGRLVRSITVGDRVLFDGEDRSEVEVGGTDYILLRERDVHAVAAERLDDTGTGLYL